MSSFLVQSMLAGIFIAFASGPMGCFLVWRRMAFFGDSMAHSALLGIALGIFLGLSNSFGIIVVCILFTFLLGWLEHWGNLEMDSILGILAHTSISLGLIWISLMSHPLNLEAILFGDILTITQAELIWICIGSIFVLTMIFKLWSKLILITLDENLAFAEGVNVSQVKWLFLMLLSMMVAFSVQLIGILLLMSLMIIPAATARQCAKSPNTMAIFAILVGSASVVLGIGLSIIFDSPTSPFIVITAAFFFLLSLLFQRLKRHY